MRREKRFAERERYLSRLRRWAIRLGVTPEETEDCLQMARLKYFRWRGVDYLEDEAPQPKILKAMMHDVIVDWHRLRQRRLKAEQHFACENTILVDETALEEQLLGEEILRRLPSTWQSVVYWRFEEGLSWSAIGERLNSTVGIVSVQFRRALEKVCCELGIVCRKTATASGIKGGGSNKQSLQRKKNDEEAQGTLDRCVNTAISKPDSVSERSRCSRRKRRGGVVQRLCMCQTF